MICISIIDKGRVILISRLLGKFDRYVSNLLSNKHFENKGLKAIEVESKILTNDTFIMVKLHKLKYYYSD